MHKKIWHSPDGQTRNRVDHVLIDKRFTASMLYVRFLRAASCGSDHFLRFRCRMSSRKISLHNVQKCNVNSLKDRIMFKEL
jgi:hypothetical protein